MKYSFLLGFYFGMFLVNTINLIFEYSYTQLIGNTFLNAVYLLCLSGILLSEVKEE